jgi:hypothetical protein
MRHVVVAVWFLFHPILFYFPDSRNATCITYTSDNGHVFHNIAAGVVCGVADEFRSKVACENDVIPLECNPNARIAVYSASYGRTEYESIQCPQPQGVPEESEYTSSLTHASLAVLVTRSDPQSEIFDEALDI